MSKWSWAAWAAIACLMTSAGMASADNYECGPDYNGDGVSNEVDAEIFEAAFGTQEGDSDFLAVADHNDDGTVGVGDAYVFRGCDAQ